MADENGSQTTTDDDWGAKIEVLLAARPAVVSFAFGVPDPDVVAVPLDPSDDAALVAQRGFPPDRVAAYVCVGTTCSAPLSDEGSLRRELDAAGSVARGT